MWEGKEASNHHVGEDALLFPSIEQANPRSVVDFSSEKFGKRSIRLSLVAA